MSRDTLNADFGRSDRRLKMQEFHICHICGGQMYPTIESQTYKVRGYAIKIADVHCFKCNTCGETILESEEAKRIEDVVIAKINKKNS